MINVLYWIETSVICNVDQGTFLRIPVHDSIVIKAQTLLFLNVAVSAFVIVGGGL